MNTRPTTSCRATHAHLTCCRLRGHAMPHMDHDGTQWDEHGVRVAVGNHPYRSER